MNSQSIDFRGRISPSWSLSVLLSTEWNFIELSWVKQCETLLGFELEMPFGTAGACNVISKGNCATVDHLLKIFLSNSKFTFHDSLKI